MLPDSLLRLPAHVRKDLPVYRQDNLQTTHTTEIPFPAVSLHSGKDQTVLLLLPPVPARFPDFELEDINFLLQIKEYLYSPDEQLYCRLIFHSFWPRQHPHHSVPPLHLLRMSAIPLLRLLSLTKFLMPDISRTKPPKLSFLFSTHLFLLSFPFFISVIHKSYQMFYNQSIL